MSPDQASTSPAGRPPLPLTRRGFLGTGAMAGAALALARQALPPLGAAEPVAVGTRSLAAHRNLFNGDCNFLFYNPDLWQPGGGRFGVRAIERYLATIADCWAGERSSKEWFRRTRRWRRGQVGGNHRSFRTLP